MSGCRHYDAAHCRSCGLMAQPLSEQRHDKNTLLALATGLVPEAPYAGEPWHFRDKVKWSVGGTLEAPLVGLLLEDLQGVQELADCPVQSETLNREHALLKGFISRWRLTPYDVLSRKGELKGLILSHSPSTGEKMLRFVLRSKEALDRIRQGLAELTHFQVVSVNIQPIPHALLEGDEEIVLTTRTVLQHEANGIRLRYPPQSFMQTNATVAQALYAHAVEWLAPWRGERTLDLFCGVGGFALHLARAGHPVRGVEINASAIHEAQAAADEQGLAADFVALPSERVGEMLREWNPQVVVVNPPRRGLAATRALLEQFTPPVLLYSSCSHRSLQEDLAALRHHYDAQRTKMFDMFPHTHHFESLTLMVRR